ncbi:MAG: FAD-binding oxidoreductase [Proteobacteria bacterium]|nr:FAD-binding oxidoreductase [Pseudomonadota bacterium]
MTAFDAAVLGGGIMGSATALNLAWGGMRVAVIEKRALGSGASGVNAGTLSLQIKRVALMPYAIRGKELWATTAKRLGVDVHYRVVGGMTLAFTEAEAEALRTRMAERIAAGAGAEMITAARAGEIEPALAGERIVLASYSPLDAYANSSVTGLAYRRALVAAGAEVREGAPVTAIDRAEGAFTITAGGERVVARRLVLAGGAWLKGLLRMVGIEMPIHYRVNQVAVTERTRPLFKAVIMHALGFLTLKQSDNGTVLIGGGWQGFGDPEAGGGEVDAENLVGNLRLARYAMPALAGSRIVRSWAGYEAHVPDFMPLIGPLAGVDDAYVIGCVRGGYTQGPYMGQLLAELILGREPEMPLFNPNRFNEARAAA